MAVYRRAGARLDGMVDHDPLAKSLRGTDVFDRPRLRRIDFGTVHRCEVGSPVHPAAAKTELRRYLVSTGFHRCDSGHDDLLDPSAAADRAAPGRDHPVFFAFAEAFLTRLAGAFLATFRTDLAGALFTAAFFVALAGVLFAAFAGALAAVFFAALAGAFLATFRTDLAGALFTAAFFVALAGVGFTALAGALRTRFEGRRLGFVSALSPA